MDRIAIRIGQSLMPKHVYYYISSFIQQDNQNSPGHYILAYRENIKSQWYFMNDQLLQKCENIVTFASKSSFMLLTKC